MTDRGFRSRPFSLDIENPQIALLKTARELGTAIVCYSPIGRGMLGGQIRSPADFEEGDFRKFVSQSSQAQVPSHCNADSRYPVLDE